MPLFYRITVYPVPNNGNFRVDLFGIDKKVRMDLLDMAGRLQKSQLLTAQSNPVSVNLPSGTYLLVFYDADRKNERLGAQEIIILK